MSRPAEQPCGPVVLVDAHVHLHAPCSVPTFIRSAVANFQQASAEVNAESDWTGCLMFADIGQQDSLGTIERALRGTEGAPYRFDVVQRGLALNIRVNDRIRLLCLAGRQLISAEGVEILALATQERFEQQRSLAGMVQHIIHCDALPVIPWGAGKWMFRRGALIAELVDRAARDRGAAGFFLGDNRLRPRGWPPPRLMQRAMAVGIGILPGSDALPLRRHARAAGSYGIALPGRLTEQAPADWLKGQLRNLSPPSRMIGRRTTVSAFVCDQVAAQWGKRLKRDAH